MGDAGRTVPPNPRPLATGVPTTPAAGIVDRVWTLLSSLRLALGLILALAALGLASVLLAQSPAGLPADSPAFAAWLERVARPRYGTWTDAIAAIQLFTVTSSVWMRLLLSLLAANTLVCTLNRLPGLLRSIGWSPSAAHGEHVPVGRTETVIWPDDERAESVAAKLAQALRVAHYRVGIENGQTTQILADRNRFAPLGTLATHVAIILFLVGAYATSAWGLRLPGFAVAEGSTRVVGLGTALRLRLDDFAATYYPDGTPRDYRSDVVVLDGPIEAPIEAPIEVARQTVRVNEPLTVADLRFHQESFGTAAELRIVDDGGAVAFADGVALDQSIGGRPAGIVDLDDVGAEVIVLGAAPGDTALQPGQVRIEVLSGDQQLGGELLSVGQTATVAGLTITYSRESTYSSFLIVRDPGAPIIWLASALLVVGVAITFGFPFQTAHIRLRELDDGRTALDVALRGRADSAADFLASIAPDTKSTSV